MMRSLGVDEECAQHSQVARLFQAFFEPQQMSRQAILGYAASVDCTDDEENKQNEQEFKSKRSPSQLSSLPHFIQRQ
jgi:hypothetical protein